MVIHCRYKLVYRKKRIVIEFIRFSSAGVGRTGTYIAVDIIRRLIDQAQKNLAEMKLDVMGIVYQLRQDRGKMVQTKVSFN
jgi:protein tyrosine phosphatase